jgi:BA14K-like protein
LSTKTKLDEFVRCGCIILLAAALLLSSVPASSQSTDDRWQAEKRLAVSKLRDCVAAYAEQDSQDVQDENRSVLLIAAIEGDCRSAFDGMIQLFGQHIDAKEIELQLRAITETTLLPAVKGKRTNEISSADVSQSPTSQIPDPALTTPIVVPDSADRRRALKGPARASRDSPPKFSPEWVDHCRAKYNSFNPRTGKYKSYGGVYRSCR